MGAGRMLLTIAIHWH